MQTPLEIVFHNLEPSDAVKADIEKRFAKLEKLHGRLTSGRVSVEAPVKSHRNGHRYEVHVDIQAPKGHIVVSREPHGASERRSRADTVQAAVRESFKAAEMKLDAFNKKRLREKRHAPASDADTLKPE